MSTAFNTDTPAAVDISFFDDLFMDRTGYVAVTLGYDGYWTEKGKYDFREWVETSYAWPAERDAMVRELNRELATRRVDVYYCPALRANGEGRTGLANERKGTNALPPNVLWADCDTAPDPEVLKNLYPITVSSGRDEHLHVYVPLAETVSVALHRRLNKALADLLGGDVKWSDEAVLRVPGTVNHKQDPPLPVVAQPGTAAAWELASIASKLGVDLNVTEDDPGVGIGDIAPEDPPAPLPLNVLSALRNPDTLDRSRAVSRVVGACINADLTAGQALSVVLGYGPAKERVRERGSSAWLVADVARMYAKFDKAETGDLPPIGDRENGSQGQEGAKNGEGAGKAKSRWTRVDLGPYLRGEVERVEPTIGVRRTDSVQFLYPGKEHACIGETEAGKSWFALACVAHELTIGNRVEYVHFEEQDPGDTIVRLIKLGVTPQDIEDRFGFWAPEVRIDQAVIDEIAKDPPTLVILDGQNEAQALHGQDIMSPEGSAEYRARLVRPFTAMGAAVISLDHVVKDPERKGSGYALGSAHKLNGLTGAGFLLENKDSFGVGRNGASQLFVVKDRPGLIRKHGKPTKIARKFYVGTMVVDDTDVTMRYEIVAPKDEPEPGDDFDQAAQRRQDDHVFKTVWQLERINERTTTNMIATKAGGRKADVQAALLRLAESGRLEVTTSGQAKLYRTVGELPEDESTTGSQRS